MQPNPDQLEKRCAPSINTKEPVPEQLEKRHAPPTVQFEPTIDNLDAGSLTTQAPQMNSVHATINVLAAWISAVKPRESWYLAGWIENSPIEFLVDPGAVVSALSLKCYENLVATGSINTPLTELDLELEAANRSDMKIYGMCSFELIVHGLSITMDTVVVDLNCQAILGMDILGDATKLPFTCILDLVEGTLSGGGHETIQLHRFHAATECFAETVDTMSIPPHSEVILWAKLKNNNGRTYSRRRTSATDICTGIWTVGWQITSTRGCGRLESAHTTIQLRPCARETKHCNCNPVTIPARTRIARGGNSGYTEYRHTNNQN